MVAFAVGDLRWAGLFVLGAVLGAAANRVVAALEWRVCPNPWSKANAGPSGGRRAASRVPVVGWLVFRREAGSFGGWVRPMLVEIAAGVGVAWLYAWELDGLGPLAAQPGGVSVVRFLLHLTLLWFMLTASLIDVDEQVIPDVLTVPATLIALAAAAAYPWAMPVVPTLGNRGVVELLHFASPHPWPVDFGGAPNTHGLLLGLACWWGWCVALMHRTWYSRHGLVRALRLASARLVRERSTYALTVLGIVGSFVIAGVWEARGDRWEALLSALVGAAVGGGMIWMVRIMGRLALRREAMGFGDVTLTAMIGAFLGWQACLMVFFLAPPAGLVIGALVLLFRRDNMIPYGPFLCLAAAFVLVRWVACWDFVSQQFLVLGPAVPIFLLFCLGLMLPLLWIVRVVREAIFGRD